MRCLSTPIDTCLLDARCTAAEPCGELGVNTRPCSGIDSLDDRRPTLSDGLSGCLRLNRGYEAMVPF